MEQRYFQLRITRSEQSRAKRADKRYFCISNFGWQHNRYWLIRGSPPLSKNYNQITEALIEHSLYYTTVLYTSWYYQWQRYCSLSYVSNLSNSKTERHTTKKHSIKSIDRANLSNSFHALLLYLFPIPSYEGLKKWEGAIPLPLMVLY